MGSPVEIEYALETQNNERPTLHLLQIKPLIKQENDITVNIENINNEKSILVLNGGMGNGHYTNISDVIYMDLDKFDKTQTELMAKEVASLNQKLQEEGREYILIGIGRWGSRDKFIGIPVFWSQIANARIIVEMGLKTLPLEASMGSHFFHNVTSMNVGYFSAPYGSNKNSVNLELLNRQNIINETIFFKHVRFNDPLDIKMDGKRRIATAEMQ